MRDPRNDKELNNIRPAKGAVKIKPREKPQPKQQSPKRIVENVIPPNDEIEEPTQDAIEMIEKANQAKQRLVNAMKGFNVLLNDKTFAENKGDREKNEEQLVINELINATRDVEAYSADGIMSLSVFNVRLFLKIKDVINHLSYDSQALNKRIKALEIEAGIEEDPKEKEKRELIEKAKELGLKIVEEE